MSSAHDTLPLGGPGVRDPAALPPGDPTRDLTRIVRHALTAGAAVSLLDRAIRSAAGSDSEANEDVDGKARRLALRINALIARRATRSGGLADPRRETVRD
jgi:hypothetical protein